MVSFKHTTARVLPALTLASIAVTGGVGTYLAFSLIFLTFALIATLAVIGTVGHEPYRNSAQVVLMILLGRRWPSQDQPPSTGARSGSHLPEPSPPRSQVS